MGKTLRRVLRIVLVLLAVVALVAVGGWLWLRSQLRASLPQLDGERALAGLSAGVTVERDALGVPTIRAQSRADAMRALGFLHGQDRFFQMDLLRRTGAGEMAELLGKALVEDDKAHRVHRFRERARRVVAAANAEDQAAFAAYAEGVNAGLAALGAKPFEYLALRTEPAPWRAEDSILVVFAMFFDLHDEDGSDESEIGLLYDTLPRELADFLTPPGTEWDAPIVGPALAAPPIPGPEVFDLRNRKTAALPALTPSPSPWQGEGNTDVQQRSPSSPSLGEEGRGGEGREGGRHGTTAIRTGGSRNPEHEGDEELALGSNNWAVAGGYAADGKAWLANDMHLGIRVPNIWYRASIVRPDGAGGTLRTTGVTLPGAPGIVVGSNGHVAWGFTNAYGDWTDLVLLELDPQAPDSYRTPEGSKPFTEVVETIRVKGGEPVPFTVKETIWGPVIDEDHQGRVRALSWIAHHTAAVNFNLALLETARTLDEAMAIANTCGAPPQNFVVADSSGRVGWTIMGQVPRRVGFDGKVPTSWADGSRRWDGWLAPAETPRIVDPPAGRVWSANARVVDGAMLALLGDGGYDLGARAQQIRDDLFALEKATPEDLLAVQLDDRALLIGRWRKLLLSTLTPQAVAEDRRRGELRRLVETSWDGKASIDSVGYRVTRAYRLFLLEQVFDSLVGQKEKTDAEKIGTTRQFEGWLWQLATERPAHLLDPRFASWDEQLLSAADATLDFLAERGPNLADRTWGERNTTRIRHPLSQAVPQLSRYLDVPPRPLPGDEDMPRVQGPANGASERLIVSPGQEEKSFFHMPVGQSGHPLSPFYRAGHRAWENGEPAPFLPGPVAHTLRLTPAGKSV